MQNKKSRVWESYVRKINFKKINATHECSLSFSIHVKLTFLFNANYSDFTLMLCLWWFNKVLPNTPGKNR